MIIDNLKNFPGIYDRIKSGEVLQVQFRGQPDKGPFTVQRMLLIGDTYWVGEDEVWARWAKVGGVTINRRRRHAMGPAEMQEWCESLEIKED